MKKNCIPKVATMLVLCCAMFGCGKETTIYGTVFYSSGNPARNIQVTLEARHFVYGYPTFTTICSTFTGTDGRYELNFQYENDDYCIRLGSGLNDRHYVDIKKGKLNRYDLTY